MQYDRIYFSEEAYIQRELCERNHHRRSTPSCTTDAVGVIRNFNEKTLWGVGEGFRSPLSVSPQIEQTIIVLISNHAYADLT